MQIERVLIIDDGVDDRFLTSLALERGGGWHVLEASDGEVGLQLARGEQPDLILLDWVMPGMDGPAVLSALKADPDTVGIPVVLLSAAGHGELDEAIRLGACGVIEKPFRPLLLTDEIEAILGLRTSHVLLPAVSPPDDGQQGGTQ